MRNYEVIKGIWEMVGNGYVADVQDDVVRFIELHRPEIAGKLPTHESLTEEMRNYPHRDNHMD